MQQRYASGTVGALIDTNFVTPVTRQVLKERMAMAEAKPCFFDSPAFDLLSIVCDRLMAQDSENRIVNVALFIDERLKNKTSDGWRYNTMPPDEKMYLKGINGIEETANLSFKKPFSQLTISQQTEILGAIQKGTAEGAIWKEMESPLFFEELLTEVTEIFFSYPLVQEEIGFVGMADANGWVNIGLNGRDGIEPEVIISNTP
ncbi:MAG: gluconate 2-dehydrogenase subunit 3 family protein [Flavobacterium sp.]|nr:gluconate 2-dehydrogenase subunit 3 family protein [Pedobacter sp.]